MAELKTKANDASVDEFIASLSDDQQREDSKRLLGIMHKVSAAPAVMWGGSLIGFGTMRLRYASGRELDWLRIGFSPRKGKIALYVTHDADELTSRFKNLGQFNIGKGCIYIKRLSDVSEPELVKLIEAAYKETLKEK